MNTDLLHSAKILIVDDEPANVRLLERTLQRAGYPNLLMTQDARHAAGLFLDEQPDLVLLDLRMPHLSGQQVLEALRKLTPEGAFIPVIVLTADNSKEARLQALEAGATDFLNKPFDTAEVALRITNMLRARFLHRQLEYVNAILRERSEINRELLEEALAGRRAAA